jgi:predicted AlkP superfamily phosphohydrolase/phosphomutase
VRKVAVIGLDSVPPELLFDKLLDKLPNIKQMYAKGLHSKLRTCDPPITIPAWMVMMTGKNPGQLGIYGFRHRKRFSYNDGYIVNSTHVKERTVWEILSAHGMKTIVLGVPPGYPPKPVPNALVVSCFLTPSIEKPFTYPAELREEVLKASGGKYVFDVTFRAEDREAIKEELFDMTRRRFDVAEHLAKSHPWDFFIVHEIGFDRLHHAFWKFFDPTHPKHVPGNTYEKIDEEYYGMVDDRIGRLLSIFGKECLTFVLSDHGSKAMKGGFCVNQWLEKEGYLTFKNRPSSVTDIEKAEIDWTKTRAWGWGGYYARIFFNVKGREAQGIIEPSSYEKEKKRLAEKILEIEDREGNAMGNQVFEPESLYHGAIGDMPDLMVYFGNLDWRSAGTVGHEGLYLSENDTGPDDSVHSMDGVMMVYDPRRDLGAREIRGADARHIAPILLRALGLDPTKEGIEGHTPDELEGYLNG